MKTLRWTFAVSLAVIVAVAGWFLFCIVGHSAASYIGPEIDAFIPVLAPVFAIVAAVGCAKAILRNPQLAPSLSQTELAEGKKTLADFRDKVTANG